MLNHTTKKDNEAGAIQVKRDVGLDFVCAICGNRDGYTTIATINELYVCPHCIKLGPEKASQLAKDYSESLSEESARIKNLSKIVAKIPEAEFRLAQQLLNDYENDDWVPFLGRG